MHYKNYWQSTRSPSQLKLYTGALQYTMLTPLCVLTQYAASPVQWVEKQTKYMKSFFLITGEAQKEMESVSGSRATSIDIETESVFSGHMIQAVFSMIWSTVVMELWKRRSSTLSYRWGTLNLAERFAEPRPGFHGELGVNPVTGRMEPLFPGWQRDLRMALVSVPVVGLFLGRTWLKLYM